MLVFLGIMLPLGISAWSQEVASDIEIIKPGQYRYDGRIINRSTLTYVLDKVPEAKVLKDKSVTLNLAGIGVLSTGSTAAGIGLYFAGVSIGLPAAYVGLGIAAVGVAIMPLSIPIFISSRKVYNQAIEAFNEHRSLDIGHIAPIQLDAGFSPSGVGITLRF